MAKDIIKIEMTKEQQEWLLKRLKIDWDEEINYQDSSMEIDTEYLESLYECYIACLGKPRKDGFLHYIDVRVNQEIAKNMRKEIDDLKERNRLYKEHLKNEGQL